MKNRRMTDAEFKELGGKIVTNRLSQEKNYYLDLGRAGGVHRWYDAPLFSNVLLSLRQTQSDAGRQIAATRKLLHKKEKVHSKVTLRILKLAQVAGLPAVPSATEKSASAVILGKTK